MKTVPHPHQTRALGAPIGWDHTKIHCGSLSIQDDRSSGYPVMKSRWEPEGFEAIAMALGAVQIELAVFSEMHPPVSLIAYPATGWTADRGRMAMAYEKALRNLIAHAEANGFKLETVDGRVQFADAAD